MTYVLYELLEAAAVEHADRVAVVDGDRSLTYTELNELSSRLANHLQSAGVRRGDRVGLYLQKSLESIAALYGVMKAGAAYVPIDPNAPAHSRAAYIVENCDIGILITGAEMAEEWPDLPEGSLTELIVVNADELGAPEVPFSITMPEMPRAPLSGAVTAKIVLKEATAPPVFHFFRPLTT